MKELKIEVPQGYEIDINKGNISDAGYIAIKEME